MREGPSRPAYRSGFQITSSDWELLLRAVKKHVKDEWIILYIERWLKAPEQDEQGHLRERVKGSPQGGDYEFATDRSQFRQSSRLELSNHRCLPNLAVRRNRPLIDISIRNACLDVSRCAIDVYTSLP